MFKKLYTFLFCTVLSSAIYGMPASISGLEEEIRSAIDIAVYGDLLEHFTVDSLIICASRTPGLAFKKAYTLKKAYTSETELLIKHFEAQYKVFLIDLAFKWYKKAPSEAMLREIISQSRNFYMDGLERTLTPEENEYLETLIGKVGVCLPKGSAEEAAEEEEQSE